MPGLGEVRATGYGAAVKIMHVILALHPPGGAENKLVRLARHQKLRQGLDPMVVSLGRIGELGEPLVAAGVPLVTCGLARLFDLLPGLLRLRRLIRRERPDIVQTWLYRADLLGGLAALSAGNRNVIWGIRNTDVRTGRGVSVSLGLVVRACAALSRRIPRAIVCVAQSARTRHIELGYDAKRMIVIPNGFEPDSALPEPRGEARIGLGLPEDATIVGSVGRYNEYKDHRNFVRAMASLAAARPGLLFVMAGQDVEPGNRELMQEISRTGFAERFHLLGHRRDVGRVLAAMDVFCLHSRSEGFPNALGEAMLAGIAAVSTDVGDARALGGGYARIVPPEDSIALAEAVDSLLSASDAERRRMGEAGRRHVEANFSLAAVGQRYRALYEAVLAGRFPMDGDNSRG